MCALLSWCGSKIHAHDASNPFLLLLFRSICSYADVDAPNLDAGRDAKSRENQPIGS